LYEFGYGLSYTTFSVSNFSINKTHVHPNGRLRATMTVTNTGSKPGTDVAQLYLHDPVASISQPVRRLRGFQRVTLDPGQSKAVSFTIDRSDFGFYDNQGHYVAEPGRILLYAGDSSKASRHRTFYVTRH
jgi:beta-glucosidase